MKRNHTQYAKYVESQENYIVRGGGKQCVQNMCVIRRLRMELNKEKLMNALDLLRMKLIQQRELTDQITLLYQDINEFSGNLISAPLDQKTRSKPGWGPDPAYVPPSVTSESQALKAHQLSKDF